MPPTGRGENSDCERSRPRAP